MEKDFSEKKIDMPCALSVATSDSGCGAGIQADLLSFAANGVYGCTALAAITAQNPDEVSLISGVKCLGALTAQLEAVCNYYKPRAAKTGMLFKTELLEETVEFFSERKDIPLVVDPVMISTSGAKLLVDDALSLMKSSLIPLSKVFTPNMDEAEYLLGGEKIDENNFEDCAKKLRDTFGANALLKGGHLKGEKVFDCLACLSGEVFTIEGSRINGVNTHGSGCTLSAAIAAHLARGETLLNACKKAKLYIEDGMKNALGVGGDKFINHFPMLKTR